jgi:hypothetical protein
LRHISNWIINVLLRTRGEYAGEKISNSLTGAQEDMKKITKIDKKTQPNGYAISGKKQEMGKARAQSTLWTTRSNITFIATHFLSAYQIRTHRNDILS